MANIAGTENINSYVSRVVRLNFLAPPTRRRHPQRILARDAEGKIFYINDLCMAEREEFKANPLSL
jgi:hypothetical protein